MCPSVLDGARGPPDGRLQPVRTELPSGAVACDWPTPARLYGSWTSVADMPTVWPASVANGQPGQCHRGHYKPGGP